MVMMRQFESEYKYYERRDKEMLRCLKMNELTINKTKAEISKHLFQSKRTK